jgi:hypothetical protein
MKSQTGSTGIALLFNPEDGWGWVVNATFRPLYPRRKACCPLYRKLGGPQGRSGRVRKISPPLGSDLQTVRSQSLYRLSYPGPHSGPGVFKQHYLKNIDNRDFMKNKAQLRQEIRQTTLDRFLKENENIRKVVPMNSCSIPGKYTSCYLLQRVQTGSEAYSDSFSAGNGTAFPGVKLPACGTDHCLFSAKVQNEWSYTSTSPYGFTTRTGTTLP